MPIYDSLGESAVEYIVSHSEMSVALVEAAKLGALSKVAPAIAKHVHTGGWWVGDLWVGWDQCIIWVNWSSFARRRHPG